MNRYNFGSQAGQAVSLVGGLITAGSQLMKTADNTAAQTEQLKQANELASKREEQELNANIDRQLYTEANEYESATGDDAERYVNDNRERIQRAAKGNIERYGKYAGEISQLGSTAVRDSINEYRNKNQAPDVEFNSQDLLDLIDGGII